jgi:hypothetical protein
MGRRRRSELIGLDRVRYGQSRLDRDGTIRMMSGDILEGEKIAHIPINIKKVIRNTMSLKKLAAAKKDRYAYPV